VSPLKPLLRAVRCLAVTLSSLTLAGCAGQNPHYDPQKPHHTPSGFRNNYAHPVPSGGDFLRWQWERYRDGLPKPPASPLLPVAPELGFIQRNRQEVAVTWIGHSTLLLQLGGLNILTDPQFSERASPISFSGPARHQPPGVALNELPHIDAVVISHSHYDHLDLASVRALYAQAGGPPMFFLPLGIDRWFARHVTDGKTEHLRAMDWWEQAHYRGADIHFLPVQHWSQRTLWDRNSTLWGAWAIKHPSFSFFFSGDMGYSQDLEDIGRALGGFDLAALAVGAYEPRWFMQAQHVDPDQAVRAHRDIGARRSIGIHWGTFEDLTDEPLDQPPKDLAAAREKAGLTPEEFFVLRHGETYRPQRENAQPAPE
jgi:N-acyl-phosphatidylethanolamine-hydrolysing phospholipase D